MATPALSTCRKCGEKFVFTCGCKGETMKKTKDIAIWIAVLGSSLALSPFLVGTLGWLAHGTILKAYFSYFESVLKLFGF